MKRYCIMVLLLLFPVVLAGCSGGSRPGTESSGTSAGSGWETESAPVPGTSEQTKPSDVTDMPETPREPVVLPAQNNLQFDTDKAGIYNYCPTAFQTEDGTRYIYYCTNVNGYVIKDYIGCRKATPDENGNMVWGEEMIVFSAASAGNWDSNQVCDPSVVAGSFRYNGETYGYLLAYLGCSSHNNQDNEVGIAVAKSPEGPFIRVSDAPLIAYERDSSADSSFQWGVGQPCLINMDRNGHVLLFYTQGTARKTCLMVDEWELSDLDHPEHLSTKNVSELGLRNLKGNSDFLNNADLVYDSAGKRFYCASDCHPNPSGSPDFISSHFRVNYVDTNGRIVYGMTWKPLATVGPEQTGRERNHNVGLLRDAYGQMLNDGYLTVYYSVSDTGSSSLWTYRIYDYYIELP